VALGLVAYLCVYQGFDGVQTLMAYALRGYKVTLLPMLLHTACFWGLGLAGGYWLSFGTGWAIPGPPVAGFWLACVFATLAASLLLGLLLRQVTRLRAQG
jgi:multidrug resistance protein, MATE family